MKEVTEVRQQLTNLLPDNYQLWINLSNIYNRMGGQDKSATSLTKKSHRLKPDNE